MEVKFNKYKENHKTKMIEMKLLKISLKIVLIMKITIKISI